MEQAASKSKTAVNYGLYLGMASIAFSLVIYYGGMMGNGAFGYVSYVIYALFIYLGLKFYKEKENGGFLRYGQGVGLSVLISLAGGILSSLYLFIFFTFIDPSKHAELIAIAQEAQLESGIPAQQLEQMDGIMSALLSPTSLSIMEVFGSVIIGLIIGLFVSAILKKEPEVTI